MKRAVVIGYPISHSLSPVLHKGISKLFGTVQLEYSSLQVVPEDLVSFVSKIRDRTDFIGFNVTLPHKETLIPLVDELSGAAEGMGAVNVVVRTEEGTLRGDNTDVIGIMKTFENHGCEMESKRAWIFGAGGAARSVAYALGLCKASEVMLENRTLRKAEKLCEEFNRRFPQTKFSPVRDHVIPSSEPFSLVVNATSVGMKGGPTESLPLSPLCFNTGFAFDLVYNPENTPFLKEAQSVGLRTMGGLDMLIYQALASWNVWFYNQGDFLNLTPANFLKLKRDLRRILSRGRLRGTSSIFLTGFMGAGKTTVGKKLSEQLGWKFFDSDETIEKKEGMSVSQIFLEKGEDYFRRVEREILTSLAVQTEAVIALGGGTLIHPDNLKTVQGTRGHLIYLKASLSEVEKRFRESSLITRPLLKKKSLEELFKIREPHYKAARIAVSTERLTPDEVSMEILHQVQSLAGQEG